MLEKYQRFFDLSGSDVGRARKIQGSNRAKHGFFDRNPSGTAPAVQFLPVYRRLLALSLHPSLALAPSAHSRWQHGFWLIVWPILCLAFSGCQPQRVETPIPVEQKSSRTSPDKPSEAGAEKPAAATKNAARALRVAAAADLRFVFGSLISAFHKQTPAVQLLPTFGSSGQLAAQLHERAPFDLFLAADIDYAQRIATKDDYGKTQVFAYARGYVGLWWPAKTPPEIVAAGPRGLLNDSVRRIAIANPRHAPYGRAAESSLRSLGLLDRVASRFVMAENVAQASQFVASGAADVGLIAKSLALSPALREQGEFQELPVDSYPPLIQGGVVVPWSERQEDARKFQHFLLSPEARAILQSAGFGDVDSAAPPAP
jgi:molybdate transport system substrate-binding protein